MEELVDHEIEKSDLEDEPEVFPSEIKHPNITQNNIETILLKSRPNKLRVNLIEEIRRLAYDPDFGKYYLRMLPMLELFDEIRYMYPQEARRKKSIITVRRKNGKTLFLVKKSQIKSDVRALKKNNLPGNYVNGLWAGRLAHEL